eukprot:g3986.t1
MLVVAALGSLSCLLQATPTCGMIHNLSVQKDARRVFQIESFGFRERGFMNLTVSSFSVEGPQPYRAGFIVTKTNTESSAQEEIENALEGGRPEVAVEAGEGGGPGGDSLPPPACLLDKTGKEDLVLDLSDTATWEHGSQASRFVGPGEKGLYVLLYCGCPVEVGPGEAGAGGGAGGGGQGDSEHKVAFKLRVEFWNEGVEGEHDYLSAGRETLPKLFLGTFVLFFGALVVWARCIRRNPGQVYHIHHMMTVLLVFKTLSMLFESIRYHYLGLTGAAEAWSIVYYLFAFLKGITLFVVVLLIGSGWSLIKPFLHSRDKRIIMVVLSLQVLNNVAQIVLEETAPGSTVYLQWRNVLHVVDIVCCCFILVPIVWSIRNLRDASMADSKAIRRLNVFKGFYKVVLAYIYFTRIVLVLFSAMLPFELVWLEQLCSELATLIFFVITGWCFRPHPDAPYLPIGRDENEEGLDSDQPNAEHMELQTLRR